MATTTQKSLEKILGARLDEMAIPFEKWASIADALWYLARLEILTQEQANKLVKGITKKIKG